MKTCYGCQRSLPLESFHRHKARKDGRQARCKDCQKQSTYEYRRQNPERASAIARRSYDNRGRGRQYLRLYGITEEEVNTLRLGQGFKCALCKRHESLSRDGRLAVDHDHETGRVRALLCHDCNTALGKLQDDPALLRRAADYIEKYKEET